MLNDTSPNRMVLDADGQLRQYIWNKRYARWLSIWISPKVNDNYAPCGSNGICSMKKNPVCSCLKGFQPMYKSYWKLHDYSGGCVRRNGLQCLKDKDEFIALDNIKLPQNYHLSSESDEVCRLTCAANCNCSAYSNILGCYRWFGDHLDMEQLYDTTAGVTIFLKLSSKDLPKQGAKKVLLITPAPSLSILLLLLGSFCYIYRKRLAKDNFSSFNKLGEGGSGLVYKGKLHNGQEVAVKRLSKHSSQGLDELINEARLIAKLKHSNLVRLLGCCIQKDEKMLVYEYLPNKSLDFFLFDQIKRKMLDWSRRMHIIEGIAQGLLYLHHYSRLRIVHRDLKASNIFLDTEMKPKISDFGMARIFGGSQLQANANYIVVTSYCMQWIYAPGICSRRTFVNKNRCLQLWSSTPRNLSGERNINFCHVDCPNLLRYAWKLWANDTTLDLLDPILKTSCNWSMALRYTHVGLLCVQEHPNDRPNMSDIVAMIRNEMKVIDVQPKQPAYLDGRRALEVHLERVSLNELTYSMMQPC